MALCNILKFCMKTENSGWRLGILQGNWKFHKLRKNTLFLNKIYLAAQPNYTGYEYCLIVKPLQVIFVNLFPQHNFNNFVRARFDQIFL